MAAAAAAGGLGAAPPAPPGGVAAQPLAGSGTTAKPPGTIRIALTGDVMLGRGVDQVLPHSCTPEIYESAVQDARAYVQLAVAASGALPAPRPAAYPWGIALQDLRDKQPDAFVINLETAVTTWPRPWPAKGINYRMHPGNVGTLTAAGVGVCCLANNHAADWGREGLAETLEALQGAGLQTAGAGRDLAEAEAPAVVRLPPPGGRLLVWAVGHESSGVPLAWAAARGRPGVALVDLTPGGVEQLAAAVRRHKQPGDLALVSVHWGSNWGFGVPPEQRAWAHALIDEAGVDVVHGHSSHHAKGAEVYRGRLILYGAGDLISDYEGISNYELEAAFPRERFRDDVGVLWYADVAPADGRLAQLLLTPTRLRQLSLHHPAPEDLRYLTDTLDRECRKLGGSRGVRRVEPSGGGGGGGATLALALEQGAPGGGPRAAEE